MINLMLQYAVVEKKIAVEINDTPSSVPIHWTTGQRTYMLSFAELFGRRIIINCLEKERLSERELICAIAHEAGHILDYDQQSPIQRYNLVAALGLFEEHRKTIKSFPHVGAYILQIEERAWELGWLIVQQLQLPISAEYFSNKSEAALDTYRKVIL